MRFRHYGLADISRVSPDILHRISAITGWELPIGSMLNALILELELFIFDNCKDINMDELLFAVRNYSKHVKEWGKVLNLNLISEVIDLYLADRFETSRKEENSKPYSQKVYNENELKNIQRSDIEAFYQRAIKGAVEPIPDHFERVLTEDGFMKGGTVMELINSYLENKRPYLYVKC